MNKVINCSFDSQGILTPDPNGSVAVNIVINNNGGDVTTGTISWNGMMKGYITFDSTNSFVVGFTVTDMGFNSHITELSITNIISVI